MSDTTFVSGTTITSTWLNDVNDHVYHGKDLNGFSIQDIQGDPYNAIGDGVTNEYLVLNTLVGSGLTAIYINCPIYFSGSITVPTTLSLYFGPKGYLIPDPSTGTLVINGRIYSDHQAIKYGNNTSNVTINAITINVSVGTEALQRAIDSVPNNLWQDYTILLANGTYNEDVRIESKIGAGFKPSSTGTAGSRAQLTITGASQTARDPNVKVKSFEIIRCSGGTYHPAIANLTVKGSSPYTNESEAIGIYGSIGTAISKVSFNGDGVNKCIMSFGSKITVEGLDFGSSVNVHALVTKHGGEIYGPDVNALNGELDHTGTVTGEITWPISGIINIANISGVKTTAYNEWDSTGLRSGIGYFAMEKAMTGPMFFNEYLSSWQTYFSTTTEFETVVDAGTTLAYSSGEGINMQTVNAKNCVLWLRRSRNIQLNQSKLSPMQMIVSTYITSVTGDGIIKIGNKGSVSEDGVYFKLTTAGLYGVYQSGAGAEVLTSQICTYAQAIGKSLVLYIKVLFDGSVIFKVLDSSYNTYKQSLAANTATGTSTYIFFAAATSAATGTANLTLSEARVARV